MTSIKYFKIPWFHQYRTRALTYFPQKFIPYKILYLRLKFLPPIFFHVPNLEIYGHNFLQTIQILLALSYATITTSVESTMICKFSILKIFFFCIILFPLKPFLFKYNYGQNGCYLAYIGNTSNLDSKHFFHHCNLYCIYWEIYSFTVAQ